MTDSSRTRTFFDVLTLPARLLSSGLAGDGNARVRVDEDAYVLDLDLPGFETDAFEVTWGDGYLRVTASTAERSYDESFHFPSIVRPDAIDATYDPELGVLTVTLPVRTRRRPRASDPGPAAGQGTAD
jgi:HSP20 family protein